MPTWVPLPGQHVYVYMKFYSSKTVCYEWGQKLLGVRAVMSLAVWLVAEGWCGMGRQFLSKEGLCFASLQTCVVTQANFS